MGLLWDQLLIMINGTEKGTDLRDILRRGNIKNGLNLLRLRKNAIADKTKTKVVSFVTTELAFLVVDL
jgi:hypothetical protein